MNTRDEWNSLHETPTPTHYQELLHHKLHPSLLPLTKRPKVKNNRAWSTVLTVSYCNFSLLLNVQCLGCGLVLALACESRVIDCYKKSICPLSECREISEEAGSENYWIITLRCCVVIVFYVGLIVDRPTPLVDTILDYNPPGAI